MFISREIYDKLSADRDKLLERAVLAEASLTAEREKLELLRIELEELKSIPRADEPDEFQPVTSRVTIRSVKADASKWAREHAGQAS